MKEEYVVLFNPFIIIVVETSAKQMNSCSHYVIIATNCCSRTSFFPLKVNKTKIIIITLLPSYREDVRPEDFPLSENWTVETPSKNVQ